MEGVDKITGSDVERALAEPAVAAAAVARAINVVGMFWSSMVCFVFNTR